MFVATHGIVASSKSGVAAPVNLTAPAIAGTSPYYVGTTITGTAGTYSGSPTVTRKYQLDLGTGYADIPSATLINWIIENKYQGGNLRMEETATNGAGSIVTYSNVLALFDLRTVGGNLVKWLDADDDRTIFATGSSVTQFDDRIDATKNIAQPSGSLQPVTGGTHTGSSGIARNVISFSLDNLTGASHIWNLTAKTIYFVQKSSAQATERNFWTERRTTATQPNMQFSSNNGGGFNDCRLFWRADSNADSIRAADSSNWLDGTRRTNIQTDDSATFENFVDGVSTIGPAPYVKRVATMNTFNLGGSKTTTETGGFTGDFMEMLVFDAVHDATQRGLVLGYINEKW